MITISMFRRRYMKVCLIIGFLIVNFAFIQLTLNLLTQTKIITSVQLVKSKSHESNVETKNDQYDDSRYFSTVRWYNVPSNPDPQDLWRLSVVSAYYDHRIHTVVVLMASDMVKAIYMEQVKYKYICVLFSDGKISKIIEIQGYHLTGYIFYCPLKDTKFSRKIPKRITLRRNDSARISNSQWTIPIEDLSARQRHYEPPPPERQLAMCVGQLYGYQNWLMLVQYIEYHRMQGVQRFIFFYRDLHWSSDEIFRWYTAKYNNLIELVNWNPDHPLCLDPVTFDCQLLRDNYCSYQLMYKYRFVANSDFDELFYTVNEPLINLLQRLDRPDRGSFQFRSKYCQTSDADAPPWENVRGDNVSRTVDYHLPIVRYNNESTFSNYYFNPKSITKPETVLKRWVHYVFKHTDGVSPYLLKPEEGYLRHYKIRRLWEKTQIGGVAHLVYRNAKFINESTVDRNVLKTLTKSVAEATMQIKLYNNYESR